MTDQRRSSRIWRKAAAQVPGDTCWFCGGRIPTMDELRVGKYQAQPWNHPLARTIHHIEPLADGGELVPAGGLAPAHRSCNSRDNQHGRNNKTPDGSPSRRW